MVGGTGADPQSVSKKKQNAAVSVLTGESHRTGHVHAPAPPGRTLAATVGRPQIKETTSIDIDLICANTASKKINNLVAPLHGLVQCADVRFARVDKCEYESAAERTCKVKQTKQACA